MIISLKKCKGLWVTSIQQGAVVGQVIGSVIDQKQNQLLGFKVKPKKDVSPAGALWLPIEHVKKVGRDMVLVSGESKLLPDVLLGFDIDRLVAMPVTSKDGRALGQLVDVRVEDKTWQLVSLELEGRQEVMIDRQQTVMGKDLVLIQAHAEVEDLKPKKSRKVTVEKSKDFSKQTSKLIKRGEKFVERTTKAMQKALKGSEANLSKVRHKIAEHDPKRIANLNKKKTTKTKKKN